MSKSPDLPGNETLPGIVKEMRRPNPMRPTGWIKFNTFDPDYGGEFSPTFDEDNGWTHAPDPNPDGMFYLSHNGEVRFRGDLEVGLMGETVAIMPEGYRPKTRQSFVCAVVDGQYVNLDSIRYRAEATGGY